MVSNQHINPELQPEVNDMKRDSQFLRDVTLLIVGMALLLPPIALGNGAVRAWGMGGAQTASARGLAAVQYNPANLAFSPGVSVGLAGAAVQLHNNSFTLARYNEITGATLSSSQKERVLADIPEGGFSLDAELRATGLALHVGRFALSVQGFGSGSGNLDRDFFDFVLFGNTVGESVDFSDTHGSGYAVAAGTASYGLPVATGRLGRLSAGLNLHYLRGFYEVHIEDAGGVMTTTMTEINGSAQATAVTAEGGSGYGLDLGLAWQARSGWTLGLVVDNLTSQVEWNRNPQRHLFSVTADTVTITSDDLDAAISETDTSYAIDNYQTTLPTRLRLGASRNFGSWQLAMDYVQEFENRSQNITRPLFNVGLEWRLTSWLQPRFGASVGGRTGHGLAGGLGMRLGFWRIDLAVVNRGGLAPQDTRGLGFAAGTSLEF